ncbi:glycosyltransferase [Salinisphaera aquimarina]|uniref:Glycosyltransferase n=1 Tax=Salinisphaera aquimarina TaxID=2094031 RepID=A0ABV7EKW7_9GAMM
MSASPLLHYVSLDGAGGVELQFVEFLHAAARLTPLEHAVVACGHSIHPLVRDRLNAARVPVDFEKYAGRFKLPKWPAAIRAARQRRLVTRHDAGAVVIWNRLRDSLDTLAAAGPARCVYWERGASWFAGETRAKRVFIDEVQAVLCNSFAARRMLELRWGYRGQIRVVSNALRPSLMPVDAAPRSLADKDIVTLGLVARLQSIKGVAIAIHAVALLRERGVPVRLRIAGDGPERDALTATAARLGLSEHVVFEGLVADMAGFYRGIDLLVHPALREPFGQIAVEANAYGIPAIVAGVDGLVEVIEHGVTGICVPPRLALAAYAKLGGSDHDLPPFVYDPALDTIATPKIMDPGDLAAAIEGLLADPDRYRRMSENAIQAVSARFAFDVHVTAALEAITGFVESGSLDNGSPASQTETRA